MLDNCFHQHLGFLVDPELLASPVHLRPTLNAEVGPKSMKGRIRRR